MQSLISRAPARIRLVALLGAVAALVAACLPLNSQEQYLLDQTNALRASAGLPALETADPLVERARWWAGVLAERGQLAHSDLRSMPVDWNRVAENVARGGTIESIHETLANSGSHRANLLDRRFTHVGMGTARGADGRIYVVQVFWQN